MINPIFILALSLFLVAISLTVVLVVAIPAFQELSRASRSAEKLFDTLRQEFPRTLEAIRLTGNDISELSEELNEGVKNAANVIKQVDQSLDTTKKQIQQLQTGTHHLLVGIQAAWRTFNRPSNHKKRLSSPRKSPKRR